MPFDTLLEITEGLSQPLMRAGIFESYSNPSVLPSSAGLLICHFNAVKERFPVDGKLQLFTHDLKETIWRKTIDYWYGPDPKDERSFVFVDKTGALIELAFSTGECLNTFPVTSRGTIIEDCII